MLDKHTCRAILRDKAAMERLLTFILNHLTLQPSTELDVAAFRAQGVFASLGSSVGNAKSLKFDHRPGPNPQ